MAIAANIAGKFWPVPAGVMTFGTSAAYGVVNEAKTHAIGKAGVPAVWGTKKVAAIIAESAAELVAGVYEWVPVFESKEAAKEAKRCM
jgi:hypothetical protein